MKKDIKAKGLEIQYKDFHIFIDGQGYTRFYEKDKTIQFYDKNDNLIAVFKDLTNENLEIEEVEE